MAKKIKIAVIVVLVLALLCGGTVGILTLIKNRSSKDVFVYKVQDFAMTDGMGLTSETSGTVTTDKIQAVYLSDTQKVNEVFVTEGQTISIGDPLLAYDTTLSDLELQRQEINVQRLELNLKEARNDLAVIQTMKPYTPPVELPPPPPDYGEELEVPQFLGGTGTLEDPYVWLWGTEVEYTEEFVSEMLKENENPYAVFIIREGNMSKGMVLSAWGIEFTKTETGFSFAMFDVDPASFEEEEAEPEDEIIVDDSSGYTAAEIAQMRVAKEAEIKNLDLALRMAKVKRDQIKLEVNDGIVLSKIDGVVKSVLDPEEALFSGQAVVQVSGGGGYYVQGAASEYEIEKLYTGQEVSIMAWESYTETVGEIVEISEYPATENYYGNGNVTYYPFTVFIDESAELREYEYVSITYSAQEEGRDSFYLEMPFVLTEDGKSYVYVADENGVLEKRQIYTGRYLWGSYIEVFSGLSLEESVAFPYGSDVKEGAQTVEGTWEDLYGYY